MPARSVFSNVQLHSDRVGGVEANAANVAGQPVRVLGRNRLSNEAGDGDGGSHTQLRAAASLVGPWRSEIDFPATWVGRLAGQSW